MSTRGPVALLATLASAGCDYIAPPDPLALDPDVMSIAIVLVGGETRARLLAGHPHRPVSGAPPDITASLIGPGWRAAFTRRTNPGDGCGGGPTFWPMPMVCLDAALPEPIREGTTYRLEGEGPKGVFSGETGVPRAPLILEPRDDTVWLPDSILSAGIPIRYRAHSEVGTLRPQVFATFGGGTRPDSNWIWVGPLDPAGQADTLAVTDFRQASLHLLGIGWNYTRFRSGENLRYVFPWPRFGVSGEGVFGYFDGAARSRIVRIIVEAAPPAPS